MNNYQTKVCPFCHKILYIDWLVFLPTVGGAVEQSKCFNHAYRF